MPKPSTKPKLLKFTKEARARFVEAIQLGATITMACNYAGFATTTYYHALKQARAKPDSIYGTFAAQVEQAKGLAAIGWLAKIEAAADTGSWQAAAWKLERRYPAEFGRSIQEIKHSGQVETGPDVGQMAETIAARIWQRKNGPDDEG